MEQQVIDAYQEIFGRTPDAEGLAYWTNTLNQNPDYDLRRALQNSPEFVQQTYQAVLGRNPTEDEIQGYLNTGGDGEQLRVDLINSSENLSPTQLGEIGAPNGIPLDVREDRPSTADLAYTLTTGAELNLPEYQVAGLDPMATGAFEEFQANKGVYKPFLEQGAESTMQGIGALGEALGGTRELAGQIAGEITPGQEALIRAAGGVEAAAMSSDPATRLAAEELMMSSARLGELTRTSGEQLRSAAATGISGLQGAAQEAVNVAEQARTGGRAVGDTLSEQLDQADAIAAEAVRTGRADLMEAAERARAAAMDTADRLYGAGAGAQLIAQDAATRSRALSSPLETGLAETTAGARGIASLGQQGAGAAAQRARMSTAEAQRALQAASEFGLGAAQEGIAGLRGSTAMYSPDMIAPYMSSYEDAAVQQALADIARQGQLQEQRVRDEAVQAGAYGGSRQAVAEQELARNVLEQQGRTAAQMRAQGYESAAARSQDAFERAMGRQQQASQLTGQLGQMGAGAAASAAQSGGQLGLSAEQLAQSSALQGAQLGLSAEQFAAANQQAIAQTGLSIEQLAAQTGLSAQELVGNFAAEAGRQLLSAEELASRNATQAAQLGLSEAQFASANAQAKAQTGLSIEQLSAQTGLSAQELAGNFAARSGDMGIQAAQSAAQIGLSAEQQRQSAAVNQAALSQAQAQIGMQGAQQAGNLGLQSANLGLSGIQAGLGAQQQAAGIGQGIASLGQQAANMGGQAQQYQLQDLSTSMQMGQMQQAQQQAELDAQRLNEYQQAMLPYQQLAFQADIIGGAPTGITSTMSQPIQTPSMLSQIGGLGLTALSLAKGF